MTKKDKYRLDVHKIDDNKNCCINFRILFYSMNGIINKILYNNKTFELLQYSIWKSKTKMSEAAIYLIFPVFTIIEIIADFAWISKSRKKI